MRGQLNNPQEHVFRGSIGDRSDGFTRQVGQRFKFVAAPLDHFHNRIILREIPVKHLQNSSAPVLQEGARSSSLQFFNLLGCFPDGTGHTLMFHASDFSRPRDPLTLQVWLFIKPKGAFDTAASPKKISRFLPVE
jgi:hypothetical protein